MRQRGGSAKRAADKPRSADDEEEEVVEESIAAHWSSAKTFGVVVAFFAVVAVLVQISMMGHRHAGEHAAAAREKAKTTVALDEAVQRVMQQAASIERDLNKEVAKPEASAEEGADASAASESQDDNLSPQSRSVFKEISAEAKLLKKLSSFLNYVEALDDRMAVSESTYQAYDGVLVKIEAEIETIADWKQAEKMRTVAQIGRDALKEKMKAKPSQAEQLKDYASKEFWERKMKEFKEKQKKDGSGYKGQDAVMP
eukprot:TRINITY_DN81603_c0_g1_i1.p1 TRINITY_DN81603_c0_g1~~TRINITY_DN81603_c0_g1_i1.p1  ORF type:complete len:256 (-),score=99.42 TRINITY_DN81603_c0_g1_i1:321-1088(-)